MATKDTRCPRQEARRGPDEAPDAELAAIVGKGPLPRTEVVKKVWDHIRAHSLQDPADKRTILADDKLKAVFGQDKVTMFEMNKLLSPHLAA